MPICNPIKRVRIGQMKTPTSKAGKEMSLGCIDSDEISKKAKKRSCFWYHYMLQRDVLYEI
jgi:hypothetical protein